MSSEIFEKNKEALKDKLDDIYMAIEDGDVSWDEDMFSVEKAKNGEPVVCCNSEAGKKYLNSRYNPSNEAEKFIDSEVELSSKATIVMVGISNSLYLKKFLEKNPDTHCVVYEPLKDLFMRVIHDIDMTDILDNPRVWLAVEGINGYRFKYYLMGKLRVHNMKLNSHIALPNYKLYFPNEVNDAVHMISDMYSVLWSNYLTIYDQREEMCRNHIMNMCFLPGCRTALELEHKFPKGFPAIIVAAGPSLEKNVDLLKEAKGKALIIAVDTAANVLFSRGIMPDFVVTLDGHKPLKYFTAPEMADVPLVADAMASTEVLKTLRTKNLIFYSADAEVWDKLFKEDGSEIQYIAVGGTVAIEAMAIAIMWGAKTIIMIGQDLAWTGDQMHADEDKTVIDWNNEVKKFRYVEGINGGQVVTSVDYAHYIKELEMLAFRMKNSVKFIDATEGGAKKKNVEIMTLREAIDEYCHESFDAKSIYEGMTVLFCDKAKIRNAITDMRVELSEGEKIFDKAATKCRKAKKELKKKNPDIMLLKAANMNLASADRYLDEMDSKNFLYKMAHRAFFDFESDIYKEDEDEIEDAIKLYERSEDLYTEISEVTPKLIEMVDEALKLWDELYEEE